jgi:hypothetical protein
MWCVPLFPRTEPREKRANTNFKGADDGQYLDYVTHSTLPALLGQVPARAVRLEPKGGVPGEGGPTGPVLFKGALLQTP